MRTPKMLVGLLCGLILLGASATAQADGNGKNWGGGTAMLSPQYENGCSSCHMAYPPMLLPAASWRKIVPNSGEHFGEKLSFDPAELRTIQAYLEANAADRSSTKRGRKIMESLHGASPERISEVPYIIRKHSKIAPDIFASPAVGGLSNCISCHPGAVLGDFSDDAVSIPY